MSKIVVKSIITLFTFVAKLLNLDEKLIWSSLTLITKKKLDEKVTSSAISIGVPFLMNAHICDSRTPGTAFHACLTSKLRLQ